MIVRIAGATAPNAASYDVDVIILALDRVEETVAAIASALAQRGVSRHVFVLDQGSAPENVTRLAAAVAGRDDATLLQAARNLGVAGGRNLLSAQGHGRMIAALDNDAEFATTDTLAQLVAALDQQTDVAAIGCRIVTHATGRDDLSSWGYPQALLPHAGEQFDTVTFVGAGHAIRRAAWEQAGGYDDTLFFCWEEYDFCLHAIARGWRIAYRGEIEIRHKVAPQHRFAWTGRRWFQFVRNRLYIERKFGASWLSLAPRMGGYLLKGTRHGLPLVTLRAFWAASGMAARVGPIPLPPAARAYLWQHDTAWRGGWWQRFCREVLAGMPGSA